MVEGFKLKKAPESVKDCLFYLQSDQLATSNIENSSYLAKRRPQNTEAKAPNIVFGLSTDILNRKGGNLFHENSKVEDIMVPKTSDMHSLSQEDMQSQRTRAEVC